MADGTYFTTTKKGEREREAGRDRARARSPMGDERAEREAVFFLALASPPLPPALEREAAHVRHAVVHGRREGQERGGRRSQTRHAARRPSSAPTHTHAHTLPPPSLPLAGEIHELREDLRSLDRARAKDAVKRVIAAMTVGKDVSALFPDVANLMQTGEEEERERERGEGGTAAHFFSFDRSIQPTTTPLFPSDDLELKKLVYLYLTNTAKAAPDLAILAVNTFVKDAADPNPLVRALAVRTMGCIRVDRITEYLCDPLQRALKVNGGGGWKRGERKETRTKPKTSMAGDDNAPLLLLLEKARAHKRARADGKSHLN